MLYNNIAKQKKQDIVLSGDGNQFMGTSKNSLSESFSRFLRVVSRYNSATYNIAFSKLPLKTEVFRGSLIKEGFITVSKKAELTPFVMPHKLKERSECALLNL